MRIPTRTWVVLVAVCSLFLLSVQAQSSEETLEAESEVLGLLLSQEKTLQRIEKAWPDLASDVGTARAEFAASLGAAHDNIVETMVATFGKEEAETRIARIAEQSGQPTRDLTREKAVAFIQEVRDQAAGEVGVDRVLIAYQYVDHPEKEFADGWREKYSVKGHPKAGPLDIQIKVPASWTREEVDSAHVLQRFFASTTPGRISFLVTIVDLKEETAAVALLPANHVFEIEEDDIADMIPDGATLQQSEVTTLLDRPAGIMVYDLKRPKLGDRQFSRARSIFTYRQKRLIMLTGTVFAADQAELDATWRRFEPLFALIDESVVDNVTP
jgi:hypothetical protein